MDYGGPDRRRGGPDRRTVGELTKILVVDSHALFRVGIRTILEREADFEVVGEAADGGSAFGAVVETSPDIVLMDFSLPAPGGIETTQRIKRELPSAAIIVLAANGRSRLIRWVVSIPPGARTERPMRTMSGEVSTTSSKALPPSLASPTISKSSSLSRTVRMPPRNSA